MRLKNFINEEKSFSEWMPIIKKDCSKFIKDIHGAKGTLTRIDSYLGGNSLKNVVIKKNTHSKRRSLDTPELFTKKIDKIFKEKFGWKVRTENVVFCWGTPFLSSDINYGFLVFPAGNYKFVWSSKARDLYNSITFASKSVKDIEDKFNFFKKSYFDSYSNKNLKKAVLSENEIMVKCDYYYLIKPEFIEKLDEELNLNWQGAKFRGRKII